MLSVGCGSTSAGAGRKGCSTTFCSRLRPKFGARGARLHSALGCDRNSDQALHTIINITLLSNIITSSPSHQHQRQIIINITLSSASAPTPGHQNNISIVMKISSSSFCAVRDRAAGFLGPFLKAICAVRDRAAGFFGLFLKAIWQFAQSYIIYYNDIY